MNKNELVPAWLIHYDPHLAACVWSETQARPDALDGIDTAIERLSRHLPALVADGDMPAVWGAVEGEGVGE